MRQRARISRGKRRDRERRAWRALSLAEEAARDGGGEGSVRRSKGGVSARGEG